MINILGFLWTKIERYKFFMPQIKKKEFFFLKVWVKVNSTVLNFTLVAPSYTVSNKE